MTNQTKIYKFTTMKRIGQKLRDDLNSQDLIVLFAYNGTGKTRLSMEFKEIGKQKAGQDRDTLYFNAFTEDLFHWDNDLEGNIERVLKINSDSKFFDGFKELSLEGKIFSYLERYATFEFKIDYEKWEIAFSQEVKNPRFRPESAEPEKIKENNIKVSRGEENIFIWCIFLAICELVFDEAEAYDWVKYFYIDDPISSLDDNNSIAVASDLAKLIKEGNKKKKEAGKEPIKIVISSHHGLFFNVMCNEFKKHPHKLYFLYKNGLEGHTLQVTDDTPFFHHVAMLSELKKASDSQKIYTHHFNMLRSILEKTATFFGYEDFSACIHGIEDEALFSRALNLLSHGKYSIYDPREMGDDNKELFKQILTAFLDRYNFEIPELTNPQTPQAAPK